MFIITLIEKCIQDCFPDILQEWYFNQESFKTLDKEDEAILY